MLFGINKKALEVKPIISTIQTKHKTTRQYT